MVVTAELPLICSAAALALVALTLFLARHSAAARNVAILFAVAAGVAPLLLAALIEPAHSAGRALWEWSAAGGPTVQASYRFDGIAAIGVAVGAAYTGAGLFGAARATERHPLLPSAVLAMGLVFFALAVTEDLIAGTVVLGVLASITILATLAVAPLPATTRLAAYLAVGIQFFVLAALLISRYGGASFRFDAIGPGAISPGSILSASIGAALFAGLYPFIPWRFRAQLRGPELERLRGVVTMPAGVGATLLLLRRRRLMSPYCGALEWRSSTYHCRATILWPGSAGASGTCWRCFARNSATASSGNASSFLQEPPSTT